MNMILMYTKTMQKKDTRRHWILDDWATHEDFKKMLPFDQGYRFQAQLDKPGNELQNLSNPYNFGTKEYEEFENGYREAMIDIYASKGGRVEKHEKQ